MLLSFMYIGKTHRLTGFIADTEKMTYKEFILTSKEWSEIDKISRLTAPGDVPVVFSTKKNLTDKLAEFKDVLGFKEDNSMIVNFGAFTR